MNKYKIFFNSFDCLTNCLTIYCDCLDWTNGDLRAKKENQIIAQFNNWDHWIKVDDGQVDKERQKKD